MLAAIHGFLSGCSVWVYLVIFFGKIAEVSTSTLRMVLINRGERLVGSMVAFIEIIIWLVIASAVLSGANNDVLKLLVYAVAYCAGNYVGSWLDEKLALGLSAIQIVVQTQEEANQVKNALKDKGFGVTAIDVQGIDSAQHYMLITNVRRKMLNFAIKLINNNCENAVITVSDVKTQKGGYLHPVAKRR